MYLARIRKLMRNPSLKFIRLIHWDARTAGRTLA